MEKRRNMKVARSIVIPAYKEERFIADTLQKLYDYLKDVKWLADTEVIVVTADADDETQAITASKIRIFEHGIHVQPGPRVGKGRDVKAGLAVATGDYVLFMDADLATPLNHLEEAFGLLEQKGGMVIGARHIHTMHKTFSRRLSSRFSNYLIRAMIGWKITDSQCGFKGFEKKLVQLLLERSRIVGWGFDFEFIKITRLHKMPITSIDIPDWKDPKPEGTGLAGDSQMVAMKQAFKDLMEVKRNQMKGLYD
jgi:dolichyl-phosphate beta-glucosyltransferase